MFVSLKKTKKLNGENNPNTRKEGKYGGGGKDGTKKVVPGEGSGKTEKCRWQFLPRKRCQRIPM